MPTQTELKIADQIIRSVQTPLDELLPEIVHHVSTAYRSAGVGDRLMSRSTKRYSSASHGSINPKNGHDEEITRVFLPHKSRIYEIFAKGFIEVEQSLPHESSLKLSDGLTKDCYDFLEVYARSKLVNSWKRRCFESVSSNNVSEFLGLEARVEGEELVVNENSNVRRIQRGRTVDTSRSLVIVTYSLNCLYQESLKMTRP